MNLARSVAEKLLEIQAVQFRPKTPFTWASGLKSPIYCDNRLILSYSETRDFIKSCLVSKAQEIGTFDTIAGVATAGIAHGMLLADATSLPYIYVRSKAKEHGKQNLIEGKIIGQPNVLVIEDLISTGGSSIAAVQALRQAGAKVDAVLSIFTYGLAKAKENFDQINCSYYSLCDYNTMLSIAVKKNYILPEEIETLNHWRENPAEWSNTHIDR